MSKGWLITGAFALLLLYIGFVLYTQTMSMNEMPAMKGMPGMKPNGP